MFPDRIHLPPPDRRQIDPKSIMRLSDASQSRQPILAPNPLSVLAVDACLWPGGPIRKCGSSARTTDNRPGCTTQYTCRIARDRTSVVGTKPTFGGYRVQVRLPALNRPSGLNVGSPLHSRRNAKRSRMSANRRISDAPLACGEGRFMTRSRHSGNLDWMPERILLTHVKDYETNGRQELARAFRFVNVGD